jgi:hypothetical protein
MKSKFDLELIGRCESYSCSSTCGDYSRCTQSGKLYAVYGQHIEKENAHEYYYCEEAVGIDLADDWTVVEIEK